MPFTMTSRLSLCVSEDLDCGHFIGFECVCVWLQFIICLDPIPYSFILACVQHDVEKWTFTTGWSCVSGLRSFSDNQIRFSANDKDSSHCVGRTPNIHHGIRQMLYKTMVVWIAWTIKIIGFLAPSTRLNSLKIMYNELWSELLFSMTRRFSQQKIIVLGGNWETRLHRA